VSDMQADSTASRGAPDDGRCWNPPARRECRLARALGTELRSTLARLACFRITIGADAARAPEARHRRRRRNDRAAALRAATLAPRHIDFGLIFSMLCHVKHARR